MKNGWRMMEIDEMDMLGFLRLRAWDARREQEKKKSKCPITKFTTNLSDMLEMDMTIDDINKFTAKIHAQVEISNIGISYNGKMNFFKGGTMH